MREILAIASKDLRLLARDRVNAFFTYLFPLLFALFFGLVFRGGGGSGKLDVALVNLSTGPAAAAFAQSLRDDGALDVIDAKDQDEGEALVRRAKADACVVIPPTFDDESASIFSGGRLRLGALVAPGNQAAAGLLEGKLNELAFRQLSASFTDPEAMARTLDRARASLAAANLSPALRYRFGDLLGALDGLSEGLAREAGSGANNAAGADTAIGETSGAGWRPVEVSVATISSARAGINNAFEISFPQGVVWGLMGCVTAFGLSLATERAQGTLTRLALAPIPRWRVLAGKGAACLACALIIQALLLAMACLPFPPFQMRIRQPATLALAILVTSFAFTGVMMLIAAIARSEGAAAGAGRAIILVLAMIGGGTIPLAFMPESMRTLSAISPFRWAVTALEGGLWRDLPPAGVLMPLAILLAIGVAGFAIGAATFKWSAD